MNTTLNTTESARDTWFEEFIATIKTHKLLLDTDTADPKIKNTYDALMKGNSDQLAYTSMMSSHEYFIKKIILDYLKLVAQESLRVQIALDMNHSEILVWAQINDDDTDTEDRLLMIEAEINGKYHKLGFDITSTIVENRDGLAIPSHYITIITSLN